MEETYANAQVKLISHAIETFQLHNNRESHHGAGTMMTIKCIQHPINILSEVILIDDVRLNNNFSSNCKHGMIRCHYLY